MKRVHHVLALAALLALAACGAKVSGTYSGPGMELEFKSGGKVVHLIRVSIDRKLGVAPEVSANKYAVNVRFIEPTTHSARSRASTDDIPFTLAFCKL